MVRATSLCFLLTLALSAFTSTTNAQDAPPPAAKVARYAYITNDTLISIYSSNSKGQLRSDGFQPYDVRQIFTSSAIDPMARFFFGLTNSPCNQISVFSIAPATGLLTQVSGSPFQAFGSIGVSTSTVLVTPNGKFVYSVSEFDGICGDHSHGSNISGFSVDQTTGALSPITGSPFSDGELPLHAALDSQGKFLFVVNQSGRISVFGIDANTGALTPVAGSPFLVCVSCGSTYPAVAKNGNLYVLLSNMSIAAFTVNPTTGFLSQLTNSPFPPHGASPSGFSADPVGRYLYASDGAFSNVLWVYAIDPQTGEPKLLPSSPFTAQSHVLAANADPKGKFLYAPAYCCYTTGMYKILSTGDLKLMSNVRAPHGSWAVWFTAGATAVTYVPKFAYVANSGANSISEYSINPDGTLFELPGSPFSDSNGPTSVASTPAGTFVYALDANKKVSGYSVGGSGLLTAVPGSPFSAFTTPAAVVTDPSNTFVFVVDGTTSPNQGVIWMEKIGANGSLTLVNQAFNGSNTPVAATMGPGSDYLFVLNGAEKVIATYQASYQSPGGISSQIATAATGNGPSALAVDPTNTYLYVTNSTDGTVSAYKISDGSDGHSQGTPVPLGSVAAGTTPSAVVAEPSGKFLYVANGGSSNVFAYKINPKTGKLTRIAGSFATGSAPDSLTVSNNGKFLYASNKSSGSVSVFTINATGTLTAGTASATGVSPTSIAATGTRK